MTLIDFVRAVLDNRHIDYDWFSSVALLAAGESQKVTAIPALTAFAALSLLVVVLWLMVVAVLIRWTRRFFSWLTS